MAASPHARPMFAGRLLRLGLAAAAASALGGCGAPYASSDPAFPGSFEQRHPIVVAAAPTSIDLYPVGGRLDARSAANVRAFVQRYRQYGAGAVTIETPVGANPNSASRLRGPRRASSRPASEGESPAAPMCRRTTARRRRCRVSFNGLKAIVPTQCGQWPEDLASGSSVEGWKNEPYSNFGCATQSMLAAQVDDPRDFVQPRALGPSDVDMRTRAIEAVRDGKDPSTEWTHAILTPIGGGLPTNGSD